VLADADHVAIVLPSTSKASIPLGVTPLVALVRIAVFDTGAPYTDTEDENATEPVFLRVTLT